MDISDFVISSDKYLNDFIINRCNKDIDEYKNIDLNDILSNIKKFFPFRKHMLFIVYKNKKTHIVFRDGDNRKLIIIDIVKRIIESLERTNVSLPNFYLPFYVSDTHFYHNNDIPFFIEAKPRNKKGILYPDQNYYSILINNIKVTYDEFKKIIKEKKCDSIYKKEDIIYFSGANTGSDKHNIRMKLKNIVEENNDKSYDIHIEDTFVPMDYFCKYKYLLNIPGHQPWSYRMTKILLMDSLIFDVSIIQTYIIEEDDKKIKDKNDKWIQIYSDFFIGGEDYVEIFYEWIEGVTSDLEVINIYNKINELHEFYDKSKKDYLKITSCAAEKANMFNSEIFDNTYKYLIMYFAKKLYKKNTETDINKFLDDLIKLDGKVVTNIPQKINDKKEDRYSGYFIKKVFLKKVLKISDRKYNVLSFGEYEKDKLIFIYENIIKINKDSRFTIIRKNDKNISLNNIKSNTQIKIIKNIDIDLLPEKINIKNDNYDIIFIFEDEKNKNLLKELIISWKLLKYRGFIIVDLYNIQELKNNDTILNNYFKTFNQMFKNEILYLKRVGKKVVIKKRNKKEIEGK